MLVDSIDNHLDAARTIDKAALAPGMYLAWCVNLGLVAEDVLRQHETLVLRVRMHDARGSELLVALGGELKLSHLNERGREFTERYYPSFLDDFAGVFGDGYYGIDDSWENYAKLAPVLTERLLGPKRVARENEGLLGGLRKRWRRLWH